jgi:TolB protein
MGEPFDYSSFRESYSHGDEEPGWSIRLTRRGLGVLLAVNLVIISLLAYPLVRAEVTSPPTKTPTTSLIMAFERSPTPSLSPTSTNSPPTPTSTSSPTPHSDTQSQALDSPMSQGTILLALREGGYSHLFAYQPANLPLTRLTNGPWDDFAPSASPDNKQVVFASNRDGQWDLYLLELASGEITRLTETPAYEGAPNLSPDGQYVVYEAYFEGNLEIMIQSILEEMEPINLSKHPAADFAPAWSPKGRQVAYVSTRSGDADIWVAQLDKGEEERFLNLSWSPESTENHPAWSPDGSALAWSSIENGIHSLSIWEESGGKRYLGSGDWPAWSPDGGTLLASLDSPNQTLLTAQTVQDGIMVLPPTIIPGSVEGLAWINTLVPSPLPESLAEAAGAIATPLWLPELTPAADVPGGRHHLVTLQDVEAPFAQLHDLVDESFQALRERVARDTGWDLLAALENAYVPLTTSLPPGLGDDWLYTGRAFAITPLPINAGWMMVLPEQYGLQTYWRIYLKARSQDGSQGRPLSALPWNLNGRYDGNQIAYEQGGVRFESIPVGYWVDFTALAKAYGWERLPALPNWQSFFPAARFNEFVLSGGQDWRSAMLELYPSEALVTPTVNLPPTLTPTPTPRWYRTPTPTNTGTPLPSLTPLSPTPTPPGSSAP